MNEGKYSEDNVLDLARKGYEAGKATFPVDKKSCALLVIDMQDEFVKPHWSPFWVPEATKRVPIMKELIEFCRSEEIPVIYTVYSQTHSYLDRPKHLLQMPSRFPESNIDLSPYFIDGTIWHDFAPEKDDIIIHKSSYGAFHETPLDSILKNMEKDTVIICGTLTNYCCSTTARQAFEKGYKVIFGSDVTAAHFPDLHEAELKVLRRGFAKVLTLKEIMKELREA
jgi:nicotinamidase-related amidase